jgi:FkbM family methyltransferase
MIKRILQNALNATKPTRSHTEQFTVFTTLCKLNFKTKFREIENQACYEQFFKFRAYGFSYLTLTYLFEEIFVQHDYAFKPTSERPLVVDCGANIGIAMLYFKNYYPQARLLCFEPNPHAYALLEKNKTHNNLSDVSLYSIALSNFEGETQFFIHNNADILQSSLDEKRGGSTVINCQVHKLSSYLKEFESVDLIKIDVEGSEWDIIDDLVSSGTLAKVQRLIVEYHHKMDNEPSHLAQFLKIFEDSGFEYNMRTDFAATGIFQDILIHFFRT